jgi:CRP/FNR family transcriptional regulator, cyclic AMP receptor protein
MKLNEEPIFDAKIFLGQAGKGRTAADYEKNQVVFSQGDPANAVYYIQKGKVKLTVTSNQGKEAVVAILAAGDFLGEGCLASQILRMETASTMVECSIMRLEKTRMIRALHDEPAFSELMVAHLLSRTMRIEEDLIDQLFNSSEKRLARVLLMLANSGKEDALEPVIAKISQQTLAEIVGTTRSRVSFFMNKFRKLGFIEYKHHLEVRSSLLNVVLHGQSGSTVPRPHNREDTVPRPKPVFNIEQTSSHAAPILG